MQKEAKRQAALKEEARKKAKEQAKAAKANGGCANCYWRILEGPHLRLADVVNSATAFHACALDVIGVLLASCRVPVAVAPLTATVQASDGGVVKRTLVVCPLCVVSPAASGTLNPCP